MSGYRPAEPYEGREGRVTAGIIADGFSRQLPMAARTHLANAIELGFGGEEILVAANDPQLTETALQATLAFAFPGHVYTWQLAIDRIAMRASELYLERARKGVVATADKEALWIAYLLSNLTPDAECAALISAEANNSIAHPSMRLACMLLTEVPATPETVTVVLDAFRVYLELETPHQSPAFDIIFDAAFRHPDAVEIWRECLERIPTIHLRAKPAESWLFGLSPFEAYWRMTAESIVRTDTSTALHAVRRLCLENELTASCIDYAELILASLGDADAFARLSTRTETLRHRDLYSWAMIASSQPAGAVAPGLLRLTSLPLDERRQIAGSLAFAMSHEVKSHGLGGITQSLARRRHPDATAASFIFMQWANEAAAGSHDRIAFMSHALSTGERDAVAILAREIEPFASKSSIDKETEEALAVAVSTLVDAQRSLSLPLLANLARLGKSNLMYRARAAIEQLRTVEALLELLALRNAAQGQSRVDLEGHIVRLGAALGERIDRTEDGILVKRSR